MSNPIKIPPSQNSKDDQKLAKNSSMCRWEMIYQKHMNVINYFQPQFSRSRARPGSWLSILSPFHCADKTMGLLFYCRGEDKWLVEMPDRSFRLIKNTFIALVIREVRWRIFSFTNSRDGLRMRCFKVAQFDASINLLVFVIVFAEIQTMKLLVQRSACRVSSLNNSATLSSPNRKKKSTNSVVCLGFFIAERWDWCAAWAFA